MIGHREFSSKFMIATATTTLSMLSRLRKGDPSRGGECTLCMHTLHTPLMQTWLRPRGLQAADIDDITQNAQAIVRLRLSEFLNNVWVRYEPGSRKS